MDINPSVALAHYGLGAAFVFSGNPHKAFPHLEFAVRLSPHDPNMGSYLVRTAEAKYLIGDDEAAVHFALKALAQPSFQWSRYAILIAALGQLGRHEEARRYVTEVTRMRPNFSVAFVRTMHPFSGDMGIDRYYDGLRNGRARSLRHAFGSVKSIDPKRLRTGLRGTPCSECNYDSKAGAATGRSVSS